MFTSKPVNTDRFSPSVVIEYVTWPCGDSKFVTSGRSKRVKYYSIRGEKFSISKWPCNVFFYYIKFSQRMIFRTYLTTFWRFSKLCLKAKQTFLSFFLKNAKDVQHRSEDVSIIHSTNQFCSSNKINVTWLKIPTGRRQTSWL